MLKANENTIKIISPAKVNLFLAVAEKQGEFHPVLNILHSLLLHDVIYMNYQRADKLQVNIEFLENEDSDGVRPEINLEDNLIYKAIVELAKSSKKNFKIDIYIEKNIPLQAGLAGGSSNAAAALLGGAKIFGINNDDLLTNIAEKLGSDVAFFLHGGCALYKGRGQILDHKIQPINREVVLVKPFNDQGLSTKDVYAQFDKMDVAANFETPFDVAGAHNCDCDDHDHDCNCDDHGHDCNCGDQDHHHKMNLIDASNQLVYADNIPLFNNLAMASEVLNPSLVEVKNWLSEKCGPDNVLLSGSGSSTFAIVPEERDAAEIVEDARAKGF